jgi:hypothetical protein
VNFGAGLAARVPLQPLQKFTTSIKVALGKMAPRTALLLALAACLAAAATAQARTLQQTTSTRYYGKTLYDCVVNAGLTTTKQMIDAAGPDVIKLFQNPTLAVTFLAPDNQNWLT